MKKGITFYLEDSQQWDEAGMTKKDQDDLILGIWHWFRGEPSTEGMSVVTKALYLNYINRIEKSEKISESFASLGKKGAAKRWKKNNTANGEEYGDANGEAITNPVWPPTPTPSPSPTPSPTPIESMGDTPMPPALTNDKKLTRFVKPTEQEVAEYCREKGYTKVNAADFIDYYESNGWMVGRNKMKNWRSTVSRWERNERDTGKSSAANKTAGVVLQTPENVKEEDYVL